MPDVAIDENAETTVEIEARHVPLGTVVQLHLLSDSEPDQIVDSTPYNGHRGDVNSHRQRHHTRRFFPRLCTRDLAAIALFNEHIPRAIASSRMTDQDHSYKHLFSHNRMVESILRGFVREAWVQQLDFSTLEKVSGSYVSDDLREREDDVIWRVRWGRNWLYVYLLLG